MWMSWCNLIWWRREHFKTTPVASSSWKQNSIYRSFCQQTENRACEIHFFEHSCDMSLENALISLSFIAEVHVEFTLHLHTVGWGRWVFWGGGGGSRGFRGLGGDESIQVALHSSWKSTSMYAYMFIHSRRMHVFTHFLGRCPTRIEIFKPKGSPGMFIIGFGSLIWWISSVH